MQKGNGEQGTLGQRFERFFGVLKTASWFHK
jgi:hypothetical protein